jgi:hypothetical protein
MGLGSWLKERGHDKKGSSLWLLRKNGRATRKLKTFVGKKDNVSMQKNLQKKCELAKNID